MSNSFFKLKTDDCFIYTRHNIRVMILNKHAEVIKNKMSKQLKTSIAMLFLSTPIITQK